ncbi:3-oxoacid CoA-transferase subunit B [Acetobacter orleanensis]|uniref:3-oxoacid CoA-transferase subunit B n=1 Tax=Acetobacter orleanensis TaxID=104099 RepID=A0A4Y3TS23_9PROT|nr:3-oxoacid CoA-transferase subunit B [Acetobacter orleanensis]KXV65736.1 3-oxoadipate CoA-transferase [Acetobacter orleanensis]PCD78631.1 3-oxoadipate CoA-transferase [Acetobacter orleanensis]GAN67306.1 3-oxoacid CoA-transferase subunit B [Acetobacter orleanensis JCM 7639]GBR23860.1 acyl CoA:acetate/3-ketoacid CoA transferase beta subunit [Acetobacter orleanensis NRIC 0473]GEB83565.1 3-oxoacid CoA-transferase subunit B [Acetobacter orleanensis]
MSSEAFTPLSRREMAARIAEDIHDGWYVNLGIGIPTLVADVLPDSKDIFLHSENGILGFGPAPDPEHIDPWLINAGKQHVTLRPGASFFHHADSFAMIRGGHLDLCILGAFEVSSAGDIANWSTSAHDAAPAVGGAMDLAVGSKRVWVATEHTTREGTPKLVEHCTYPLTAPGVVSRIYTNLAVIDVEDSRFIVRTMVPGLTREKLQNLTGAKLYFMESANA